MERTVPIGLLQMSCSDDPGANLGKAIRRISEAADQGARIICTQELFRSRYFCQTMDIDHFRHTRDSLARGAAKTLAMPRRARHSVWNERSFQP